MSPDPPLFTRITLEKNGEFLAHNRKIKKGGGKGESAWKISNSRPILEKGGWGQPPLFIGSRREREKKGKTAFAAGAKERIFLLYWGRQKKPSPLPERKKKGEARKG